MNILPMPTLKLLASAFFCRQQRFFVGIGLVNILEDVLNVVEGNFVTNASDIITDGGNLVTEISD